MGYGLSLNFVFNFAAKYLWSKSAQKIIKKVFKNLSLRNGFGRFSIECPNINTSKTFFEAWHSQWARDGWLEQMKTRPNKQSEEACSQIGLSWSKTENKARKNEIKNSNCKENLPTINRAQTYINKGKLQGQMMTYLSTSPPHFSILLCFFFFFFFFFLELCLCFLVFSSFIFISCVLLVLPLVVNIYYLIIIFALLLVLFLFLSVFSFLCSFLLSYSSCYFSIPVLISLHFLNLFLLLLLLLLRIHFFLSPIVRFIMCSFNMNPPPPKKKDT